MTELHGVALADCEQDVRDWMSGASVDHRGRGFAYCLGRVLAEYDRRGTELERLRARVAELEDGPLIYGVRVPDGRVLALSESPGHVAEGYTQMQARRGPWEVSS